MENSRIFITNINKNLNTNGDEVPPSATTKGETAGEEKEKMSISGPGHASIVTPLSVSPAKKSVYIKPLKATRVINKTPPTSGDLESQDQQAKITWTESAATEQQQQPPTNLSTGDNEPHLTEILPELLDNPLWFAQENATASL